MGGLFDIKGEVGFQGCSVNEIGAALAFGEEENYFAAKAAGHDQHPGRTGGRAGRGVRGQGLLAGNRSSS